MKRFLKILVMSDSHGNKSALLQAVESESPDLILHLGDNDRDCAVVESDYPEIPLRTVRGNCDRSSSGLDIDEFTLGGKRFFMTHGHLYSVKTGFKSIFNTASARGVDVLLFGHTHSAYHSAADGIIIVNPGSIGMGGKTYAVLGFKDGAVVCDIKRTKV